MSDRERVRAAMDRHRETNHDRMRRKSGDPDWQPIVELACADCLDEWPCDAAVLAGEVERLTSDLRLLQAIRRLAESDRMLNDWITRLSDDDAATSERGAGA